MTVSTTINKISYAGNGTATVFAIPFPFQEAGHLKVYQMLDGVRIRRTDWTIENGNLIFAAAPVDKSHIVIMRELPLRQETDYRENEILPAETLERDLDKLTMLAQQLAEELERSVKVDVFSDVDPEELGKRVERVWSSCDNIDTVAGDLDAVRTAAALLSVKDAIVSVASVVKEISFIVHHIRNEGGLFYAEYVPAADRVVIQGQQDQAGFLFEEV